MANEQVFKSFKDMKTALNGEEDFIGFKRFDGQITGKSNLNVKGFLKMCKGNVKNRFIVEALSEAGIEIQKTGDIAIVDTKKAQEFFAWYQESVAHKEALNQNAEETAEARPVITEPVAPNFDNSWSADATDIEEAVLAEEKSTKKGK